MTKPKLNNSKARVEQVTSTKVATIKLGLDVHADSLMVVRIVDHSGPQPAQKFTPSKFREWVNSTSLRHTRKWLICKGRLPDHLLQLAGAQLGG